MEQNLIKNKLAVYEELEINEDHIKQMEKTITELRMENNALLNDKESRLYCNSNNKVNETKDLQDYMQYDLQAEKSSEFVAKEKEIYDKTNRLFEKYGGKQTRKSDGTFEDVLNDKEKQINDLKIQISFLERSLNAGNKIPNAIDKKIETVVEEVKEKSLTIQDLTNRLGKMEKLEENHKQLELEILNLNERIVEYKNIAKINETNGLAKHQMCLEDLKSKSEEIGRLNEKLHLLECIVTEKETNCSAGQKHVDGTNLETNCDGGLGLEELKHVLYNYMLGKQPVVSAKKLASIVKFDTIQLNTVLQMEKQKYYLLQSLGL